MMTLLKLERVEIAKKLGIGTVFSNLHHINQLFKPQFRKEIYGKFHEPINF